jgi:hypothetical protein
MTNRPITAVWGSINTLYRRRRASRTHQYFGHRLFGALGADLAAVVAFVLTSIIKSQSVRLIRKYHQTRLLVVLWWCKRRVFLARSKRADDRDQKTPSMLASQRQGSVVTVAVYFFFFNFLPPLHRQRESLVVFCHGRLNHCQSRQFPMLSLRWSNILSLRDQQPLSYQSCGTISICSAARH